MTAHACWAGVVVTDLARAVRWYAEATGAAPAESSRRWAELRFDDGSALELHEGDPGRPGLTFPSYGSDPGPAVLPAYAVDDVEDAADGLVVARALPGWLVVVAPGLLRVVLADRDSDPAKGLVGFAFASPEPSQLRGFLERLATTDEVEQSARPRVIPCVAGEADAEVHDPDGNPVRVVRG